MNGNRIERCLVPTHGCAIYVRHNGISTDNRPTLLFVHGLGESGLCFEEVFTAPGYDALNLVVVDLAGYGASSSADDYRQQAHVQRLIGVLDELEIDRVVVVGHSMGGDIGTLMATRNPERVRACVNIEGNLTKADLFISGQAFLADRLGRFDQWFTGDFMEQTVLRDWGASRASVRRYYASLHSARPEAFLANALEMWRCGGGEKPQGSAYGARFRALRLRRLFCCGGGISKETGAYIATIRGKRQLRVAKFPTAGHWVMIDACDKFYQRLLAFVHGVPS